MKLPPPDGAELIARERERQFTEEKWTRGHDDGHKGEELALAAVCYALPEHARKFDSGADTRLRVGIDLRRLLWPWKEGWWKPKADDRVRELVKAGALIAAEIDRLQRAASYQDRDPASERQ